MGIFSNRGEVLSSTRSNQKNHQSKHNNVRPVKHNYILNSGLLWCTKCGSQMEGRSGTGKFGKRYYYYRCKNDECKFKVPAKEIEKLIINRIKELSKGSDLVNQIVKLTNSKLQKELPQLKEQKTLLKNELKEIKNFADNIINKWSSIITNDSTSIVKEKLDSLGKRKKQIENGIQSLENMIADIERDAVNKELVMLALNKFTEVFDHLQPYKQKELLKLVVHKAVLGKDEIKIALYGRSPEKGLLNISETGIRSQTVNWLPLLETFRTFK